MNSVLDLRAIYGHFAGTPFIQPRLASVKRERACFLLILESGMSPPSITRSGQPMTWYNLRWYDSRSSINIIWYDIGERCISNRQTYVYIYICICIYMYIYIYIYIYSCIYIYIYIYVYVLLRCSGRATWRWTWPASWRICLSNRYNLSIYLSVYIFIYLSIYISIYLSLSLSLYIYIYI